MPWRNAGKPGWKSLFIMHSTRAKLTARQVLGGELVGPAEGLAGLGLPALIEVLEGGLPEVLVVGAARLDAGGHVGADALAEPSGRIAGDGHRARGHALRQQAQERPLGGAAAIGLLGLLPPGPSPRRLFLLAPGRVDRRDVRLRRR